MEYRRLGSSGLKVSILSYGAWVTFGTQLGVDAAYDLMRAAYQRGVNFFDNAEIYAKGEAERVMGKAVERGLKEGVWERDDLVISTKIFFGYKKGVNARGLSRKHLIEGTKASLKRLNLNYVDVLFAHRFSSDVPMEEIVRGFNYCLDKGWAFYWGTSEWSTSQIEEACQCAKDLGLVAPIVEQPQYSMLERRKMEKDFLPLFKKYGYGTTIWSPLASGVLTGKYSSGKAPPGSRLALEGYKHMSDEVFKPENKWRIEKADELKSFCITEKLDCTVAQLAIAWTLKNPNVSTCLLGATKLHQLEENLDALKVKEKLTPELMKKLEAILGTAPGTTA